jgi:tetratricopeptide (TPR) repeat protein
MKILVVNTLGALLFYAGSAAAVTPEVTDIQRLWASANYQMSGKAQDKAMLSLVERCQKRVESDDDKAEMLVWCGIVKSTYAGITGGLSALKYAKAARDDFQKAIDTDPTVLAGSAQTSLGTLYHKVPGWPLGFGSDSKAKVLLLAGIQASPSGIDSNYFYADFLYENGDFKDARAHLQRAQKAEPRDGRPVADEGRRTEIAALLAKIDEQLGEN